MNKTGSIAVRMDVAQLIPKNFFYSSGNCYENNIDLAFVAVKVVSFAN
jgi:hypothetical protein